MPTTTEAITGSRRRLFRAQLEAFLLIAAGAVIAFVASVWWLNRIDASSAYRSRYGTKVSQNSEEWLVRDFFKDRRGGTFVDVGAADYKQFSNTYYLETALGWSGIAIDAQSEYGPDYMRFRPRTKFYAFFVGDRDDATVAFFVPLGDRRGTASSQSWYVKAAGHEARSVRVPTVTLNTLLPRAGIQRVDFLSVDIERAEPLALAGFNIERFQPSLVCIEAHAPIRQLLLNYFTDHHYVLVSRYLGIDNDFNLYFMPRANSGGVLPSD
jgi:FkbM family methyltransferase